MRSFARCYSSFQGPESSYFVHNILCFWEDVTLTYWQAEKISTLVKATNVEIKSYKAGHFAKVMEKTNIEYLIECWIWYAYINAPMAGDPGGDGALARHNWRGKGQSVQKDICLFFPTKWPLHCYELC